MIDRYGNPQALISAHMETLVNINKVKNMENLEALRKLYDIENCMRNLKSLKYIVQRMAINLFRF